MSAVNDITVTEEVVYALEDCEPDDLAVVEKVVGGVKHCRFERGWSLARQLRLDGRLLGIARGSAKAGEHVLVRKSGWHTPEPAVG